MNRPFCCFRSGATGWAKVILTDDDSGIIVATGNNKEVELFRTEMNGLRHEEELFQTRNNWEIFLEQCHAGL